MSYCRPSNVVKAAAQRSKTNEAEGEVARWWHDPDIEQANQTALTAGRFRRWQRFVTSYTCSR